MNTVYVRENPGLQCVFRQHCNNVRGNTASVLSEIGLNYAEHQKPFITYHKRLDTASCLAKEVVACGA